VADAIQSAKRRAPQFPVARLALTPSPHGSITNASWAAFATTVLSTPARTRPRRFQAPQQIEHRSRFVSKSFKKPPPTTKKDSLSTAMPWRCVLREPAMEKWEPGPGCVIQHGGQTAEQSTRLAIHAPEPNLAPAVLVNGSSKYQHRQHEHGRETARFPFRKKGQDLLCEAPPKRDRTFCAKHPPGRSGKRVLSLFARPFFLRQPTVSEPKAPSPSCSAQSRG